MSRIHKNLFEIAKRFNQKIHALNCNFLSGNELKSELKNVSENGILLLKNLHLASNDVIEFVKKICSILNGNT